MTGVKNCLVLLAVCLLASCASYQPRVLPTQLSAPDKITDLVIDQTNVHYAPLRQHRFDISGELDMDDVAILAVLNNPDLKLARDDAGVAYAQAFAAGLLPDPQLALSGDLSNSGGPGATRAFSAGLSYDLMALVTHDALAAATRADRKKTDMTLLWQEWQLVAQARLLYVRLVYTQKTVKLLDTNIALFEQRVANNAQASARHLVSNDAVLPEFIALQDLRKQRKDLTQQLNQLQHDLNSLLGLSAQAEVSLLDLPADQSPLFAENSSGIDVRQLLQRPDLLALKSGTEAEDERYRAAILAQFPAVNLGFTRARDNAGVYSSGFGVTISLPLFNRNRGNVAIELATREKMLDEYQQRLNSGYSDIDRLVADQRLNRQQLVSSRQALDKLNTMVDNAETAYAHGNMDGLIYTSLRSTWLSKQIEILSLQQAMLEQDIALQSLTGADFAPPRL